MTVDPARAGGGSAAHAGRTYFFCCDGCRERFTADPEGVLARGARPHGASHAAIGSARPHRGAAAPAGAAGATVADAGEYTCPMHPEIRRRGPGACPICGMALEPARVTLEERPDPELRDMTRRLVVAAILTAPVLVLGMLAMEGTPASHRLQAA